MFTQQLFTSTHTFHFTLGFIVYVRFSLLSFIVEWYYLPALCISASLKKQANKNNDNNNKPTFEWIHKKKKLVKHIRSIEKISLHSPAVVMCFIPITFYMSLHCVSSRRCCCCCCCIGIEKPIILLWLFLFLGYC